MPCMAESIYTCNVLLHILSNESNMNENPLVYSIAFLSSFFNVIASIFLFLEINHLELIIV
jgi:hypothetical protein